MLLDMVCIADGDKCYCAALSGVMESDEPYLCAHHEVTNMVKVEGVMREDRSLYWRAAYANAEPKLSIILSEMSPRAQDRSTSARQAQRSSTWCITEERLARQQHGSIVGAASMRGSFVLYGV